MRRLADTGIVRGICRLAMIAGIHQKIRGSGKLRELPADIRLDVRERVHIAGRAGDRQLPRACVRLKPDLRVLVLLYAGDLRAPVLQGA